MASKWSNPKKEVFKLSPESAEAAVRELTDYYRIDIDDFEGVQKTSLELALNRLQKAYQRGELANKRSEKGFQLVQKLVAPPGDVKEIVYEELKGELKLSMDGFDPNDGVARQHALIGAMTGLGSTAIGALKAVDLGTAESLAHIFFTA